MKRIIFLPIVVLIMLTLSAGYAQKTGVKTKPTEKYSSSTTGLTKDLNKLGVVVSRSKDNRYEVYKPMENKVIKDTKTGLIWTPDIGKQGLSWDGTKKAVEELNKNRYGGYSDWRMPTIAELKGIYEEGKAHKSLDYPNDSDTIKIDPIFEFSGVWVWSSEIKSDDSSLARCFGFLYGFGGWDPRTYSYGRPRVLAVRSSEKSTKPVKTNVSIKKSSAVSELSKEEKYSGTVVSRSKDNRYEVYKPMENKVIKDTKTGLIWTPDIGKQGLSWDGTKKAVEELNKNRYGGYSDWRMPTIAELKGIYEEDEEHKTIDYDGTVGIIGINPVFDFSGYWVWSSEIKSDDSSSARYFNFLNRLENWYNRTHSNYRYFRVLAVRS